MDIERIKKLRDGGCACCGAPVMVDGMQMQILTFTESGQPIFPYDNETESLSMMLPVCGYHMALAGEGWIFYHDIWKIPVQPKIITELETMTDSDLRLGAARLKRLPRNDVNMIRGNAIKAVLDARAFSPGDHVRSR